MDPYKMETNERILISQNDSLAEQIKSDLTYFKAPFNKLVEAFEALDLGRLTPETFDEIRTGQAAKSVSRYQAKLEKSLDDMKVFNATLRAKLLEGKSEVSGDFLEAARAFMETTFKPRGYGRREDQVLTVDFISLDADGKLTISDQDTESILEAHCRYYIQTPEEKELYSSILGLCEKYKEFYATAKRLQLNDMMILDRSFGVLDNFARNIGPDVEPDMNKVIGSANYSKRLAKSQQRRY